MALVLWPLPFCPLHPCSTPCSHMPLPLQALTSLRQRVRKYNKEFDNLIEVYRQNPMDSEEEEEEKEEKEKEEEG